MSYFILNYVDNFLSADYKHRIYAAHAAFVQLLAQVGISRSQKKSIPPTQVIDFIGNMFDSSNMTIGITSERKIELMQELNKWRFKTSVNRKQLERLVGKLQFVSNCVRPGCLFVSRLLEELKGMDRTKYYSLSDTARQDIRWWYNFIPSFNGTAILWLLDIEKVDAEISMDASLRGVGGVSGKEYYRVMFPPEFEKMGLKITHLELWAVIIAVRLWGSRCTGLVIRIRTDNEVVATIVNTGRSHDPYLQKQLRELTWWLTGFQFRVKGVHLTGLLNQLPDLLSRWGEGHVIQDEFWLRIRGENMVQKRVPMDYFRFSHDW